MTIDRPEVTLGGLNRFTARLDNKEFEKRFLEEKQESDLRLIRASALLAVPVVAIFAILDWIVIVKNLEVALLVRGWMGIIGPLFMYAMTYMDFFRNRLSLVAWIATGSLTFSYGVLNIYSDSPDEYLSGFIIVLMYLYFLLPVGFLTSVIIGVVCTVAFAAIVLSIREIDIRQLPTFYSQFAVTLLAGGFAVYRVNTLRRYEFLKEMQIEKQKQQYYELLTRILPESIVNRIENGEEQIADNVPEAVILFADVVGFTEMAAKNQPEEVVSALNGLFEKFDERVSAHKLEKIKTIGDAYMVAGNVPESSPNYIASIAELALDMQVIAADHVSPDQTPFEIRIGFHAGPVLAGVVGKSRFGYDLWGDTVNLASRLQGSAPPGAIYVSQYVRNKLKEKFNFKSLGEVTFKGIGDVSTWELINRKRERTA